MTDTTTPAGAGAERRYRLAPHEVLSARARTLRLSHEDIAQAALDDYGIRMKRYKGGKQISTGYISQVMSGKTWPPDTNVLIGLCLVLDLGMDDLSMAPDDDPAAFAALRDADTHAWPFASDQRKGINRTSSTSPAQGTLVQTSLVA